MESFEFGLVRKLCTCRNLLVRSYPSSVREIRFLTMHETSFRHSLWKLFAGTWLYWLLGNGFTKTPQLKSISSLRAEEPVVNTDHCDGGFEYSDAILIENDARFVFQFIQTAMDNGATVTNYTEAKSVTRRSDGLWSVDILDKVSGETFSVYSKVLVNACGPLVDQYNQLSGQTTTHRHKFSKGVHLIVNQITQSNRILTFFADDGRLFFAIPMGNKTCIGTTDTRVDSPFPSVTDDDREFILNNINKRLNLQAPLTRQDIISERCGVRPLVVKGDGNESSDWLQMSRKHAIEASHSNRYISIFGGKLTDCINVGEEICQEISKMEISFPHDSEKWYGEPPSSVRDGFLRQCHALNLDEISPNSAGEKQGERLWRLYGERAFSLLDTIGADATAAKILVAGSGYMKCEFEYIAKHEMVTTLEDFLRRRSKLALTRRHTDLKASKGLREACDILFGEQAQSKWDAYFQTTQVF